MSARNRMPPWHEHVRLSNGRDILIRPIRPEDAGPIQATFTLLEPDEIRQRFLHPMKELSHKQAEQLTRPDPRRDFALVAAEPLPPGEALVGAVAVPVAGRGRWFGRHGSRNSRLHGHVGNRDERPGSGRRHG